MNVAISCEYLRLVVLVLFVLAIIKGAVQGAIHNIEGYNMGMYQV